MTTLGILLSTFRQGVARGMVDLATGLCNSGFNGGRCVPLPVLFAPMELGCCIVLSLGTEVPTFLFWWNWSANLFANMELECQLFCSGGTGVPTCLPKWNWSAKLFCHKWNWSAMLHLASNKNETGAGCVYFVVGTGMPNWSAKLMWQSSSYMNIDIF